MSKLTAAIMDLKRCLNPKTGQTYSDAIHVLEAADKIPAQQVLFALENIQTPNASNQNVVYNGLIEFVRTLSELIKEER